MSASPLPPWLVEGLGHCLLALHIQPGAKRTEVVGEHGEALKIRLSAPPVDGKANAALLAFLAEKLRLPKNAVRLHSGQTGRHKRVWAETSAASVLESLGI